MGSCEERLLFAPRVNIRSVNLNNEECYLFIYTLFVQYTVCIYLFVVYTACDEIKSDIGGMELWNWN